jgi:DNA polymerase-3 subunit gamma/tau
MDNVVLYRKYRPQNFSEVIGQEHIVKTLTNSLISGLISHAYLFSGPRGSGKTTIARIFAKAINCSASDGSDKPCDKCDSCAEIIKGKSLDLAEIDAASNTSVDNVREIIESIKFPPVKSNYKIFIIDECHQISKAAANALLKTLEEPPAHAIFMLATTEAHKMIPTIISRCQRFDFKRLQTSEIIRKLELILQKEKIKYEKPVLSLISLNARGSFRDAESLLDKCISFTAQDGKITTQEAKDVLGIVEVGQISKFFDLILVKDAKSAIEFLNLLSDRGADLQEFAKTLVFYLRQCLLFKIGQELLSVENSGFSVEEIEKIKSQTEKLSEKDIQRMLELFIEAENKMKYSSILQLPMELAVVDLVIEK